MADNALPKSINDVVQPNADALSITSSQGTLDVQNLEEHVSPTFTHNLDLELDKVQGVSEPPQDQMNFEQAVTLKELELVINKCWVDLEDNDHPWQEVSHKKKKKVKSPAVLLTGKRPTTRASSRSSQ